MLASAACGGGSQTQDPAGTTAAPATAAAADATTVAADTATAAAEPATAAADAATTAAGAKYEFPWTGDPVNLSYFYVDFSYAGMVADPSKLIDAELQKLLGNINIENLSVGWSDLYQKLDLMFASGELPDMMVLRGDDHIKYGASGSLLDFTPYLDLMPNYVALSEKYNTVFNRFGDQILALRQVQEIPTVSFEWTANSYFVDKGYEIPTTYDEILEVCRRIKADYPESYPLNFCWDGLFYNDFNTVHGSGSSQLVYYNLDTDQWEYGIPQPQYKSMTEFLATAYAEKLLHPNQFDGDWSNQWPAIITDPHSWFLYSGFNEINDLKLPEIRAIEPTFEALYMAPPLAPDNSHPWVRVVSAEGQPQDPVGVSAKTENPEFVCAFIDYLQSDEIGELLGWGVEGVTYNTGSDGTKSFSEDIIIPSRQGVGAIDPIAEYSLYPHLMCKQLGLFTKNNDLAMNTFHYDPTVTARANASIAYMGQHPEYARITFPVPALTDAESEECGQILTDVGTYVSEQRLLFILGKRSMGEWDKFLEEAAQFGDAQRVADIYNSKEFLPFVK
jgi:putative aldouronate transport system substrate-binding protein